MNSNSSLESGAIGKTSVRTILKDRKREPKVYQTYDCDVTLTVSAERFGTWVHFSLGRPTQLASAELSFVFVHSVVGPIRVTCDLPEGLDIHASLYTSDYEFEETFKGIVKVHEPSGTYFLSCKALDFEMLGGKIDPSIFASRKESASESAVAAADSDDHHLSEGEDMGV